MTFVVDQYLLQQILEQFSHLFLLEKLAKMLKQ
jgi:hypothetical protein